MTGINEGKEAEFLVPVGLTGNRQTPEDVAATVTQQHERYGLKRFVLAAPGLAWRYKGYPDITVYEQFAEIFCRVRELLKGRDLALGWWSSVNLKSGRHPDLQPIVKGDGEEHPFANCPSDAEFKERHAKNIAAFCRIARPDFIMIEDDYCISAAAGKYGCFCKNHLAEFEKRVGRRYEREELVRIFGKKEQDSIELLKRYKEMLKDTMVDLSARIRRELDKQTPEIPICLAQAGTIDNDGNATEAVCRALAGKNHRPLCRLYGAYYNGGEIKNVPELLYHAVYCKQHLGEDFGLYHESDTYPHTRFFTSARMMKTYLGITYSHGLIGSVFQTQQHLDDPGEETAYGKMLKSERARLTELIKTVSGCTPMGVEIPYDPFYNFMEESRNPLWVRTASAFGIPFVTTPAKTAFLDEVSAKYLGDDELKRYLSGNLFLDGDAAYHLTKRGYGRYLGVSVGENAVTDEMKYDFAAKEVICPPFDQYSVGKNMPAAHTYAKGKNGIPRSVTPLGEETEIISKVYTCERLPFTVGMTRFENELGGRVVVMGMTLRGNGSQSLFNYRRMKLFDQMLLWCGEELPFVKSEPYLHLIANRGGEDKDFAYQLTVINLGEDTVYDAALYLPMDMRNKEILYLTVEGCWEKADVAETEDGIIIKHPLEICEPLYLKLQ
ncbi:MAG: hypothetical protein IKM48_00415 [Clostridia bacterium]|nr:hypothetical protein [Clostridia bacterium]